MKLYPKGFLGWLNYRFIKALFIALTFGLTVFISCKKIIGCRTGWTKTFGGSDRDWGYSVRQTRDGGYIITGYTRSYGAGSDDVYLIKTDASGNQQWQKTFGGSDEDRGYSVQETRDGGYIIAGTTRSFGAGYEDVYLIKTDASGNQLWFKTFGGSSSDYGFSVQQTSDGGHIITGYTHSFGTDYDVYLIKTDVNGNQQWFKTLGGPGSDGGRSVQQTRDGGYIITGTTTSYGAGGYDVYLIKTDASGNQQWQKTFGGSEWDWGYSVQETRDGGYIITGTTTSYDTGDYNVYLIKTDANGNQQWFKIFGGSKREWGYSVQQTRDGGYIITGYTPSYGAGGDVYLIKTDASGDQQWFKTLGGSRYEEGRSVHQTRDGGYIITGVTTSYGAGWWGDVYLIKTDARGNP